MDPLFGQFTLDGDVNFPTFGRQTLHVYAHVVATTGGDTPLQRWAYIGGPGTLPTIDMLSLGGDQLVYIDAHYAIPIRRWTIRVLGSPLFELREALGGAAFQEFPTLEQLSGVRLALAISTPSGSSTRRAARRKSPPESRSSSRRTPSRPKRLQRGGRVDGWTGGQPAQRR